MDIAEAKQAKGPVAPPAEPISPAPSASASGPGPGPAQTSTPTPTPNSTSTPALTSATDKSSTPALAPVGPLSSAKQSTSAAPPSADIAVAATSGSAAAARGPASTVTGKASSPAPTSAPVSVGSAPAPVTTSTSTSTSLLPVYLRQAPSPAPDVAAHSATVSAPATDSVIPRAETTTPPRQVNGHKPPFEDGDVESELSEPDSTLHSPPGVGFAELEDEIIVGPRTNGARKSSPLRVVSDHEDEVMADVDDDPVVSHYPKRKRTSLFNDLSESKIEIPNAVSEEKATPVPVVKAAKPARHSLSSVKGVILGHWRDSPAPDDKNKHAVIGFIDIRDRLRTRIQPINTAGTSIASEYPLPPGPGGSWVTFERVVFSKHLVGLDHYQVKEYVRLRSEAVEDTEEARKAAEKAAVKEAVRRAKENPLVDSNPNPPLVAYGAEIPEHLLASNKPEAKKRKISGGFAAINPTPTNGATQEQPPYSPRTLVSQQVRPSIDPLPGTRPTRILIGHWKLSSEANVKDRHAVYGILGQNDMFRVKLVRETRDGRYVDGNFPVGAGALWIQYEDVNFEDHLKSLARLEVKEYCRVRQWQIDHGETPEDRITNETKAVYEAQTRAGTGYKNVNGPLTPAFSTGAPEDVEVVDPTVGKAGFGGHELRQSRRVEAKGEGRPLRQALPNEAEARPSVNRVQSVDANRERAAAVAVATEATNAAAAAAAIPMSATNGKSSFHESEDMQRLNKIWARQETLRVKAGAEDAKIYGGIKYERKSNGPFMGKLVSQGSIINIDGEDYVEYRVLTKPSFF
ncbi:hypothetical protein G7046_g8708 [Stylonectria norvegica]|nr:hypothetical protein G7046_g8708 [Stylonectria norvegica]